MFRKKSEKRSPLKDRPLRLPGQSIQEQIEDILIDILVKYFGIGSTFLLIALYDWLSTLQKTPHNPWLSTAIAAVIIAFCVFKGYRAYRKIAPLKLGRDGERIVAEQLDVLKQQGAVVLHDVVGDGFNLDHVILSKNGIYVVETKTWSKPNKGSPSISYDGHELLVNGFKPGRDPVAQAVMNARWLTKTLQDSTGKTFAVRPVVLFPGWFVQPIPRGCAVWVLEPKALPSFVQHEPMRIADPDLHLAAYHLTRIVRTTPR